MCDEPYMVIGLGNAYDFVIKNVNEPETYGTFQGDKKSIKEFIEKVNGIVKENEWLKAQLYCNSEEGVCNICKYQKLIKMNNIDEYYIAKCERGHEECSKESVRHCEDFKLKRSD